MEKIKVLKAASEDKARQRVGIIEEMEVAQIENGPGILLEGNTRTGIAGNASATIAGGLKARFDQATGTLYLTNNGSNA